VSAWLGAPRSSGPRVTQAGGGGVAGPVIDPPPFRRSRRSLESGNPFEGQATGGLEAAAVTARPTPLSLGGDATSGDPIGCSVSVLQRRRPRFRVAVMSAMGRQGSRGLSRADPREESRTRHCRSRSEADSRSGSGVDRCQPTPPTIRASRLLRPKSAAWGAGRPRSRRRLTSLFKPPRHTCR
jgi:hypothetical protein